VYTLIFKVYTYIRWNCYFKGKSTRIWSDC